MASPSRQAGKRGENAVSAFDTVPPFLDPSRKIISHLRSADCYAAPRESWTAAAFFTPNVDLAGRPRVRGGHPRRSAVRRMPASPLRAGRVASDDGGLVPTQVLYEVYQVLSRAAGGGLPALQDARGGGRWPGRGIVGGAQSDARVGGRARDQAVLWGRRTDSGAHSRHGVLLRVVRPFAVAATA